MPKDNRPAYVFVDAGQIRAQFDTQGASWKDVNLHTIAGVALQYTRPIWQGDKLVLARAYVYDAVRGDEAGQDGDKRQQYRRDVMDWLDRNELQADTHVRRGNLAGAPTSRRPMRQKGVDVQLTVDALVAASAGNCDACILVTGDADFVPLAEEIKRHGVLVAVATVRSKMSDDLRAVADRVGYLPENVSPDWDDWVLPKSS